MSVKIVPAVEADVPELLQLIRDLEPEAVVATPEMMIENIFKKKYAECLIARSAEGQAIGLALYFFTYSTWLGAPGLYLEDLYVAPKHRAKGLGKLLFGHLGEIAKERGCKRVEWRVLKASRMEMELPGGKSLTRPKWNAPSIAFYKNSLGAETLDEWDTMRIEGDEGIERLVAMKK
ncbi:diamine N-acetyltransferase, partial [Tremellales sp. Uapishka_1]